MGRRVVLIVGPPGAGKSTLARRLKADEGLRHLEAEQFEGGGFVAAARAVGADPHARASVVRCCASIPEQRRWESMVGATETVVLDVDPDVCAQRVADRRRPRWRGELLAAKQWRDRRGQQTTGLTTAREW